MIERQAQCSCGNLRLTARGDPKRVSVCHCLACQRRTGSPFGQQARFARKDVRVSGHNRRYQRIAESGNWIAFHFCPDCGSTVYYELELEPDLFGVPVGAFADPDFPPPRISVYEEHMHHWVALPGSIKQKL